MEKVDTAVYFPFSIFNLSTSTVVIDSMKLTFPGYAAVFIGVSLTASNAIFWPEKRQRLFSLLISILRNRWLLPRRLLCKLREHHLDFILENVWEVASPPGEMPCFSHFIVFFGCWWWRRGSWFLLTIVGLCYEGGGGAGKKITK